jgi:aspartate/methionine/tyrosine aminotransferase
VNRGADRVTPFHAAEINRLARERERRGLPVVHMEFGEPSAGAPRTAIEAGRRVLGELPQPYWESRELTERIAAHYLSSYGLAIDPSRIVLTMGGSAAIVLCLSALFSPGARVALARPGYPPHRNVLHALGLVPVELDCGDDTRFQPTASMIAALDPAPEGLIVTSPSNPTGSMLGSAELHALQAACAARGIQIVSDEAYHGITYGARAHSMLEHACDAVVINTFSKYWCMTGWRLGWAVVPEPLVGILRRVAVNMFLTPPTLSQHVALAAMDEKAELDQRVAAYAENRRVLVEALRRFGIVRLAPADGAFYLYADVGHLTQDSLSWCKELLDGAGVALNTGMDFDTLRGNRFIRISFAVSREETMRAIELLDAWLRLRRRA